MSKIIIISDLNILQHNIYQIRVWNSRLQHHESGLQAACRLTVIVIALIEQELPQSCEFNIKPKNRLLRKQSVEKNERPISLQWAIRLTVGQCVIDRYASTNTIVAAIVYLAVTY